MNCASILDELSTHRAVIIDESPEVVLSEESIFDLEISDMPNFLVTLSDEFVSCG